VVSEAEALRKQVQLSKTPLEHNPTRGPIVGQVNAEPSDLVDDVLDGNDDRWFSSRRSETRQCLELLSCQQGVSRRAGLAPSDVAKPYPPNTREITSVKIKPINVAAPVTTSGIDFGAMVRLDGGVFGAAPTAFSVSFGTTGTYTLDFNVPRSEVPRIPPTPPPVRPPRRFRSSRETAATPTP
jgi:hypothetical protein